jgi:hypothetical protein
MVRISAKVLSWPDVKLCSVPKSTSDNLYSKNKATPPGANKAQLATSKNNDHVLGIQAKQFRDTTELIHFRRSNTSRTAPINADASNAATMPL